jgi:HNH endonuclease
MPSRIEQVAGLFARLTNDLALVRPGCSDQVLCPLCLRAFGRAAISDMGDDGLSLEHIIPGALGGTYVTLSCRRCNRRQGSALDAHLVRMIRTLDWAAGDGSTLKGTVQIGDAELPMEGSWSAGEEPTTIKILGGKPKLLEEFQTMARGMGEGDTVNLTFSLAYVELKARRALVRLGYLALFDQLGYQYVLSGAGECVRKLLAEGDIDALRGLTPRLSNVEEERVKPSIIVSPVEDGNVVIAHLILVRTETLQKRYHAVLLPGAAIPEANALSVLAEVRTEMHGNRFTVRVRE